MKKLFTIVVAVLLTVSVFAQTPDKMSYQAVIRNSSDVLVTNTQIGMEINIRQGSVSGTVVYTEIQTPTTNTNGLVSIEIGGGAGFNAIDWSAGTYFIETKTAVVPPLTTYTITGTSQLMSVPYALHAKTAESFTGTITETDPVFAASEAHNITAQDITNLDNLSGTNTGDQDISGITSNANNIATNVTAIAVNTAKVGYSDALVSANSDVVANSAKVGVTPGTDAGQLQYWDGSAWVVVPNGNEGATLQFVGGVPTWTGGMEIINVTNPTTGKIWMDRNLGASQVATSSTDAAAYGDLYQWGRGTDGHEKRTSGTTSILSSSDTPGHGDFIKTSSSPYDWRSPQNDNLWQGVSGTNNPCPNGYRLPIQAEWEAERVSWGSSNAAGAFASPLKLPIAGYRNSSNGLLYNVGSGGYCWSSTVDGAGSCYLYFYSSNANIGIDYRAGGNSVRCLKD